MAVDRHVRERYRIIDGCFRNSGKQYDIHDLHEEVNRQLAKIDCQPISKRTHQKDIAGMKLEYDLELDMVFGMDVNAFTAMPTPHSASSALIQDAIALVTPVMN